MERELFCSCVLKDIRSGLLLNSIREDSRKERSSRNKEKTGGEKTMLVVACVTETWRCVLIGNEVNGWRLSS